MNYLIFLYIFRNYLQNALAPGSIWEFPYFRLEDLFPAKFHECKNT